MMEATAMQKKLAICGVLGLIIFLGFLSLSHSAHSDQNITALAPKQASDLIKNHNGDSDFVILDIRTPGEYQSGHLQNSILIDFYSKTFLDQINRLDRQKSYLIYCRSGNRSSKSLNLFKELHFLKIYHLSSGINGWNSEGLLLVK
jgi:rhodanese-related sulfurtransferase